MAPTNLLHSIGGILSRLSHVDTGARTHIYASGISPNIIHRIFVYSSSSLWIGVNKNFMKVILNFTTVFYIPMQMKMQIKNYTWTIFLLLHFLHICVICFFWKYNLLLGWCWEFRNNIVDLLGQNGNAHHGLSEQLMNLPLCLSMGTDHHSKQLTLTLLS